MIASISQWDLKLFYFINQTLANDLLDIVCPVLRDRTFLAVCYVAFATITYRLYPQHFLKIVAIGAISFFLTDQISSSLIKPFFNRVRPCNDSLVNARLIIEHCGSGFSFVSAHATNSFGMATFLSFVYLDRKRCIYLLILWALLVSFSQVYVGVHYPGDVLAGGLLGAVIGITAGLIYRRIAFVRVYNT